MVEYHAAQLVTEAGNFFRVGCRAVALGKSEEFLLSALLSFNALLHELDNDSVGAQASLFRETPDVTRRGGRKTHALANDFVRGTHRTIVHQNGDSRLGGASIALDVCGTWPLLL